MEEADSRSGRYTSLQGRFSCVSIDTQGISGVVVVVSSQLWSDLASRIFMYVRVG